MQPAAATLEAWRNARFAEEYDFTAEGDQPVNLSGYVAAMQIRMYGAAPGSALISLGNVAGDTQGARVIEPAGGAIVLRIDEATLTSAYDSLAAGAEPGSVIQMQYDVVLTPPGGGDEVWMQGDFLINPGITV